MSSGSGISSSVWVLRAGVWGDGGVDGGDGDGVEGGEGGFSVQTDWRRRDERGKGGGGYVS